MTSETDDKTALLTETLNEEQTTPVAQTNAPATVTSLPVLTAPEETERKPSMLDLELHPPKRVWQETEQEEQTAPEAKPQIWPIPAELLPQPAEPPAVDPVDDGEDLTLAKDAFWRRALTGNPDTVPEDLRRRCGADDISRPAEEQEYELLSTLNRSWLADHSDISREALAEDWATHRAALAEQCRVADDEGEIFGALSEKQELDERQKAMQTAYEEAYMAALKGNTPPEAKENEASWASAVRRRATQDATERREALSETAGKVAKLLGRVQLLEKEPWESLPQLKNLPMLTQLVDELDAMDAETRRELFVVAGSMAPPEVKDDDTDSLLVGMWRSARRGANDLAQGLTQAAGNLAVGALAAADYVAPESGAGAASRHLDKTLQLVEKLRSYAKESTYPITLQHEPAFWETLAMQTSEAMPAAALSFCGNAGMALSAAGGLGAQVAELRQEMPEGSLTAQTAAGVLALGVQAGASVMLNRIGAGVLARTLGKYAKPKAERGFVALLRKVSAGIGEISWEALKDSYLGQLSSKVANMALSLSESVGDAVNWQDYGEDIESIQKAATLAALNLPYILIGAGHVSLHHFRNPHAVAGDLMQLEAWGVPEPMRKLILAETDPVRKGDLLYKGLHSGTRWGGLGFMEQAARALRLLHSNDFHPFESMENIRDFLHMKGDTAGESKAPLPRSTKDKAQEVQELAEIHAPGEDVSDVEKVLPLLRISQEWMQQGFRNKVKDYPRLRDWMSNNLTRLGDFSVETAQKRREALQFTVDYLDALSYRFLLNSTSFGTMRFSGSTPEQIVRETEALRRKLFGKVAESVLVRAAGASEEAADDVFGKFVTDFYTKQRFASGHSSWLRYVSPKNLAELHIRALSDRALRRGAELRRGSPELQEAYWMVQGLHYCTQALSRLLPHLPGFQAALSRSMTSQEAYAHMLTRELGDRLPRSDWYPQHLTEDVTDHAAVAAKHQEMAEKYRKLTGLVPEQGEDAYGNPLWRILCPDGHYTHWHGSEADCINELAVSSRMRYLPMEEDMSKELLASAVRDGNYDAERLGTDRPWRYSYFDRLSSIATGDMRRFWMEDATRLMPGISIGPLSNRTNFHSNSVNPHFSDDPEYIGAWQIDGRTMLSPYSIAKARFEAYWRHALSTGWADSEAAADFLKRRGTVDPKELERVMDLGEVRVRHHITPEIFFSGADRSLYQPYAETEAYQQGLAKHLGDYTMGYFLAHINEMPMPPSVREWFALTPFRLEVPLYTSETSDIRQRKGRNDPEQSQKWNHQAAAEQVKRELELADIVRAQETAEDETSLRNDPFYPFIREAMQNKESRRAEQAWGYCNSGMEVFRSRRQEMWNLLDDPVRAWSLMDDSYRSLLRERMPELLGDEDADLSVVPEALVQLSEALKAHPELHFYDLENADPNQLMRVDLDPLTLPRERRFDDYFEHPEHTGDEMIRSGFDLRKKVECPDFLRDDESMQQALRSLALLRRTTLNQPYTDADGNIWWFGEKYGGEHGRKPRGVGDEWHYCAPMAEINRIMSELPSDGSSVMDLGFGEFSKRPDLPQNAFAGSSVYRSPDFPLSQLRLMPGEFGAAWNYAAHPYMVQSFVGAPMWNSTMLHNKYEGVLLLVPLDSFNGDVSKEYVGHMAGWRGKEAYQMCLDELMRYSESEKSAAAPGSLQVPLSEVLMQLTEDSRFSRSLAGRAPHELTAEEAMAATWFHTLARHVYGNEAEKAQSLQELINIRRFFTEHPDRLEAVTKMIHERRLQYDLDPNDVWEPVVAASRENRHFKAVRREMERQKELEAQRLYEENMKRYKDEMLRIKHRGYIYKPSSDDY